MTYMPNRFVLCEYTKQCCGIRIELINVVSASDDGMVQTSIFQVKRIVKTVLYLK